MAWIIYIIVTAAALVHLFRPSGPLGRRAGGFRSWRTWTVVAGMALIAFPGAVTLLGALFSSVPESPFQRTEKVLAPKGAPAGMTSAKAYLVRLFVSDDGNEPNPRDFVQAVVPLGEPFTTELKDGTDLSFSVIHRHDEEYAPYRLALRCSFATAARSERGAASFDVTAPIELEPGFPTYQKIVQRDYPVGARFGALLSDRYRPSVFRFLCTPLHREDQVDSFPADQWWENQQEEYRSLVLQKPTHLEISFPMNSEEFSIGDGAVAESGLFFLIAGIVLFLAASPHGMRTFFLVAVYLVVYTAAVDSLVLTIQSGRLLDGSPEAKAAAAVETAASRMHAISAAEYLIEAARSETESLSRCCALCCLKNRSRILDAIERSDTAKKDLALLSDDPDDTVSRTAREIMTILDDRSNGGQ